MQGFFQKVSIRLAKIEISVFTHASKLIHLTDYIHYMSLFDNHVWISYLQKASSTHQPLNLLSSTSSSWSHDVLQREINSLEVNVCGPLVHHTGLLKGAPEDILLGPCGLMPALLGIYSKKCRNYYLSFSFKLML